MPHAALVILFDERAVFGQLANSARKGEREGERNRKR